jgi:hypothetical protein
MKRTKIHESYVVDEKIFSNRYDAEKYRDELDAKQFSNYPKSSFDTIVYYEIYTHHGDRSNAHNRCNGAFSDAAIAYREMQNYSNDWCSNGTGWMEQVTLKKGTNGKVIIEREQIYKN